MTLMVMNTVNTTSYFMKCIHQIKTSYLNDYNILKVALGALIKNLDPWKGE